jgi:hypothetical protein
MGGYADQFELGMAASASAVRSGKGRNRRGAGQRRRQAGVAGQRQGDGALPSVRARRMSR